MVQWLDVETTTDRRRTGGESSASCHPHNRGGTTACRPSSATSGLGIGNFGANRCHLGRRSGYRPTTTAALPRVGTAPGDAAPLGWAAQGAAERRARSGVLGPVGRAGQRGGTAGPVTDPGGAGTTLGPTGGRYGGCWPGTGGASWPRTRATPRAIPRRRRRGKKTPRNAGFHAESGRSARTIGPADVSGRSPLRPHGAPPALLGPPALATGHAQWL